MLSDKETLEACITKAIEGGWAPFYNFNCTNVVVYDEPDGRAVLSGNDIDADGYGNPGKYYIQDAKHLIFDHDFAKALWGEARCLCGHPNADESHSVTRPGKVTLHGSTKDWQYHLQQLAIAEDRISHLRENA